MKIKRFCDGVELGLGVCSNAVRRAVYDELDFTADRQSCFIKG